jgi:uncharacterized protein DUF1883
MDHLATQFDLATGDVVEVRIEQRTNVRLMTLTNYQAYRSLRDYRAMGSGFTAGVVRLAAPHAGRWVLVLDLGGRAGTIRHSGARITRAA